MVLLQKPMGFSNMAGANHLPSGNQVTSPSPSALQPYKPCHNGNHVLLTMKNGAELQCGGWSKHATWDENTVVVDLTGREAPDDDDVRRVLGPESLFKKFILKVQNPQPYGWISLPLKDFANPWLIVTDWIALAADTYATLQDGHNVMFACQGGHGRTGTTVAILMAILAKKHPALGLDPNWTTDPVKQVRNVYCDNAVDTSSQEKYVYDMLDLPNKVDHSHYKSYTAPSSPAITKTSTVGAPLNFGKCPLCHEDKFNVKQYGMCKQCRQKWHKQIKQQAKDRGQMEQDIIILGSGGVCLCGDSTCIGIFTAGCGHTVHGQPGSMNKECDDCYNQRVNKNLTAAAPSLLTSPIKKQVPAIVQGENDETSGFGYG